jgi:1,4-dihydroxy-2-naphthoate octaprenyltransferase
VDGGRSAMGTVKRFLDYVEIRTKITSVFAFLLTLAYLRLSGRAIDPLRSLVFFCGMFLFDLTATTINNYTDTKKDAQPLPFQRSKAFLVTIVLLLLSAAFGIYLVTLTDVVVLLLGLLCFFFGVIYSYGPIPLSHTPFGEMASGFFYGVLIPLILFYINDPKALFTYALSWESISVSVRIVPMIGFLLLAVLPFCLTANIMLANNICDAPRDVLVHRFTLAFYLKKYALYVFAMLYYASYLSVIALVVFGFISPLSLLLLVTVIPVQKNINVFFKKQVKAETFSVSIKNFVLIISVHIILIFAGSFLPGWDQNEICQKNRLYHRCGTSRGGNTLLGLLPGRIQPFRGAG